MAVLGFLAAVLAVAAIPVLAIEGVVAPGAAVVFAVFIAVGEFARVTLPGDRDSAPIGAAAALGYSLLPEFGGDTITMRAYQVVAVTAIGTLVGVAPHVLAGRSPRLDVIARRIVVVAVAATAYRNPVVRDLFEGAAPWVLALEMVAIAVLAGLVDVLIAALVRSTATRAPYLRVFLDEARYHAGIGSAIGATGVLVALSGGIMGYWALPVFCVPLLLTQYSFKRYATIRATYRQTIRSLARVTEVGGYTEDGHAQRVCELSLRVGRELGLSEAELLDLEYAALMHDLGQLSLTDPIPNGATALATPVEQRLLAEKGAEVIRQTGVLDRAAEIVARQAEPYRRPGEATDPSLPLASRIVRVVNAYDDLAGGNREPGPHLDALERLRLGMAYDYDPHVVETLSRIVGREPASV